MNKFLIKEDSGQYNQQANAIIDKVMNIMGWSRDRAILWYRNENPLFGMISPETMVIYGRYQKLERFLNMAEEDMLHNDSD